MTIRTEAELRAMRAIGAIVGRTLKETAALVEPGMTTAQVNAAGAAILKRSGARSSPPCVYGFPAEFCISVNHEAAHGIPGERVLSSGDLIKLDLTAELNGYLADAAITVAVGTILPAQVALQNGARAALHRAIGAVRAGQRLNEIGRAAERESKRHGLRVVRALCGHGVGRTIHEDPREILNYYDPRLRGHLREGQVLAIEPHLTTGSGEIVSGGDGWSLVTADGSPVANFEHTVVVTSGQPLILTAA